MDESSFVALVEEIAELDAGTVALTNRLEDIDWDSLSNITFIAEIDTKFGATINSERLADAETVANLLDLLNEALTAR